jgi:hypothetical protein
MCSRTSLLEDWKNIIAVLQGGVLKAGRLTPYRAVEVPLAGLTP